MLAWLDSHGLRARVTRGYGVLNDDPATIEPRLRRYDACVEAPAGLSLAPALLPARRAIPGGAYVVHRHVGPHRRIGAGFSYIYRTWVPGHGLQVDLRRPCLEVYLNDPGATPAAELMTDVCVPVFPTAEMAQDGPHEAA
jgi:AraC family transcriptional regulator